MKQYYTYLKSSLRSCNNTFKSKKNSLKLLLSVALIFVALAGNATIYYVSSSGNDSNSGTSSDKPWKSLAKVNSFTFKPGDQILFKKGEQWTGSITVTGAGTSGSPVLYSSYGTGAKPKIYGSEKITNWTKHSGNIYKATVSKAVNQIFVNDEKVRVSRYPNSGYFKVSSVSSTTSFTSSDLSSSIDYKGASWFGRTGYYYNPTHIVTSSSGNSISLDAVPQKDLNEGEGFFLMNKLAFIDQPGEWAYDPGSKTIYLWMSNGDSPANYDVKGSVYDSGIYASGKNYIKVQGLELLQQAGQGIQISRCSNWVIDGNDFNYPDGYAIIEETYGENHTISNNKVKGPNHIGMQLRTHNSKVTDNVITDIGLYDNIGMTGNGRYYYGSAIFIGGKNNLVRHNRIIDINYNGIFFAGPDNLIEYNFIENTCLMKGDGGGIYTTQPGTNPTTGSVVKHNIIINTVGSNEGYTSGVQFGEGIYIDESAHGVTVEYNTVYKSANAGIKLHKCDANIIRHNTVMDARYAIQLLNHSGSTKTQVHNNILFSTGNGDVNNYEPRQLMIRISSPNAVVNDNVYRNPYESSGIFRGDGYLSFAEWKSQTGYDSNSKCNHTKLNTGEKEQLFYNDTKSDKTINLGNKVYKDLDGKQVTGSITLKSFTSRILISTGSESEVVENKSPVIDDQHFEFLAPKKANEFIGQVVASDPDAGQELTYTIVGGNEENLFQIGSTTGNVYSNFEIPATLNKTVNLVVQVRDNSTSPLSADATISINIKPSETEQVADVTAPVISSFSIPSTSNSLLVAVTLTATDNVAVTGYNLTETSAAPQSGDGGWTSSAPFEYTFSSEGAKILYAWVKDAAGNISSSVNKSVTITLPEEVVEEEVVVETPTPADSVEYITICEGQDYMGWTESGTYERVLTGETTVQAAGTNQILNPDFSDGTNGWSNWNATGYNINLTANNSDYNSAPSSLQVDCTANGTSISSIQLISKGNIALETGKIYELSFYAKATTEFEIGKLYIHKGSSPYTNYGTFDVSTPAINTSWKKYQLKFTANQSVSDGSFRIYLGKNLPAGHKVYFDDFSFSEYSEETVSTDKVMTTYLTVNPSSSSTEEVTIAEGEEYLGWTQSGEYTRTIVSVSGCDSIITTNLSVTVSQQEDQIPSPADSVEYIAICEGQDYMGWTESGTYERMLTGETTVQAAGTNQILNPDFSDGTTEWSSWSPTGYNLNLIANSNDYNSAPSSLQVDCFANGTYNHSVQLISKGDIALEAGKNYTLTFYAKASTEFTVGRLYIHKGSSPYTNYGSFDVSKPAIKTSWNQYQITFTANQSATDGSFRIYLGNDFPEGHKVYFDDFSFSEYSEETVSTDKLVVTYLTVNPSSSSTEEVTIAEGEEYLGWTQSGEYTRTIESVSGCDSTITTNLNVTVIPEDPVVEPSDPEVEREVELVVEPEKSEFEYETEYVTICEGDDYNGWTEAGVYETMITSETSPHIMMTTYLTVEATVYVTETIKIWAGENYNGWTESGHYERILVSDSGCDSVVVTKLIVRGKGQTSDDDTAIIGQPILSKEHNSNDFSLENAEENEFLLYPNPARTYINVEYRTQPGMDTMIEIVDGSGRIVHKQEARSINSRIDFNQLSPGMYYLRSMNKQSQRVEKFIIK